MLKILKKAINIMPYYKKMSKFNMFLMYAPAPLID